MNFLPKKILSIGIKNASIEEHKKIRLLNSFCLCWLLSMIIFCTADFFLLDFEKFIQNSTAHLVFISTLIFTFFLQYKNLLITARMLFIGSLTVSIWFFCFIEPGKLIEQCFIVIPLISLTFIENKWINTLVFFLAFASNIFNYEYRNEYINLNYQFPVLLTVFVGAYLILNYAKSLNKKNEKLLGEERDKVLSDKVILQKQEAELRELNDFKSHFFINLSHEIRTPITLIKGYASKIKIEQDENKKNLDVVNTQIAQIETILNNILDLSKLDENKLHLDRSNYELSSFLNKHYADFKELFNHKNIQFYLNLSIVKVHINMDANLLSKALNNLLNNALKFTPKDGAVTMSASIENDLIITITDNGIGIPNEDLDKVFNRFYQSKNHITKSQGSGIGLSFTKSILNAHGFIIDVKSEPNIKTSFQITIPKKYITIDSIENEIRSPEIVKKTIATQKKHLYKNAPTILIVDDHKQMLDYLSSTLAQYNLFHAENGKEAIDIIKAKPIDLLVTDYMMPVMDGEALVREVKKMHLKIPIIILTARVDDFAKLKMLRIGVDGYLNKPFVEEELQLFVKNSLQIYRTIIKEETKLNTTEKENLNTYANEFHQKITSFIAQNINDLDFNIQNITEHFNISQSTLNRRTKSILGQTANQIILQVKIEKARELQLKKPHLSKKEIGYEVGIKNTSYLFEKIAEKYGNHYIGN